MTFIRVRTLTKVEEPTKKIQIQSLKMYVLNKRTIKMVLGEDRMNLIQLGSVKLVILQNCKSTRCNSYPATPPL